MAETRDFEKVAKKVDMMVEWKAVLKVYAMAVKKVASSDVSTVENLVVLMADNLVD